MRSRVAFAIAVSFAALLIPAMRGTAQQADSLGVRVQRMVSAGDRDRARAMVDSAIVGLSEGTPEYADALFWRAYAARDAADAERDYLRVAIEYPFSPRAEEGLFALSQLRRARGDRTGERRLLERLLREHPSGRSVPRGGLRLAHIAFEDGDAQSGCRAIRAARVKVSASDVELANQLEYFIPRCSSLTATDSTRATADSAIAEDTGAPGFSVQVAAFAAKGDADALVRRLKARGFEGRVFGARSPYRVRIGRYPTRIAATDALARVRRSGYTRAFVVDAEPR
jgi:hypothetical protein